MPGPLSRVRRPLDTAAAVAAGLPLLARAGLLQPLRPTVVPRAMLALLRDGISPAAAYGYGAARYPRRLALADDDAVLGGGTELTFAEAAQRCAAAATRLRAAGVREGDAVGIVCRNSAAMVLAAAALSSIGADLILMNASASADETAAVAESQRLAAVVHDESLAGTVRRVPGGVTRLRVHDLVPGSAAGAAGGAGGAGDDLASHVTSPTAAAAAPLPPWRRPRRSRYVLLTSGTTGRPKGASRGAPADVEPLLAMLSRIPYRVGDTILIGSPLFHAWGFGNLGLALGMSATIVLHERFEPEATLAAIERHRVRVLTVVPVMLQRLLDLPADVTDRYDLSSLEVVASSGSALPGGIATRFMDRFGDVLYNMYGSTEAAWASIATPADLRIDPATAGRPPFGTTVRVLDTAGKDAAPGATGRIAVKNSLVHVPEQPLPGVPPGFVLTGDLGHVDRHGLLFVDGREDDMIVSGGENIYPIEVENVLLEHPAVREVAVIGVSDEEFGQRLRAAVVLQQGAGASEADLKNYVRSRLARFKVPREVVFLPSLPRNATGKTLRRDLQ